MENLTLLETVHGLAWALLLGGALGLAAWVWRGRSVGANTAMTQTFGKPGRFAWAAMLLGILGLPVSGWWIVHVREWSLGQTWILGSSVLFLAGSLLWLLAMGRFGRLTTQATSDAGKTSVRTQRFALGYAGLGFLAFVAILGLLIVKPL